MRVIFVDFEASALDGEPVELGWCDEAGRGASCLIQPAPGWTTWSMAAETIHGISRRMLAAEGRPAAEVAAVAVAALGQPGITLLSDAPQWDQGWMDALLRAGGTQAGLHLGDFQKSLDAAMAADLQAAGVPAGSVKDIMQEVGASLGPLDRKRATRNHRALPDAQVLAAHWRAAMGWTQDIAAAWRRHRT